MAVVDLRPTYQALIVFAFAFTMYNGVHYSINDTYGVTNNDTVSIQKEYGNLQENIRSGDKDDKGLLGKIKTLTDPLENPFATIGAGLYIVPQLLGVLTAPLDIAGSILGTIFGALGGIVPGQIRGFLSIMIAIVIVFSLIEMYLRINRA